MFAKNTTNCKLEVVIGAEATITGELASKGTIRVDGTINGNITADMAIIGEKGSITGNITAKSVIAAGKVTGDIHAEKNVEIQSKGEMIGDIHSPKLVIAEGAVFEGRSVMLKNRTGAIAAIHDACPAET